MKPVIDIMQNLTGVISDLNKVVRTNNMHIAFLLNHADEHPSVYTDDDLRTIEEAIEKNDLLNKFVNDLMTMSMKFTDEYFEKDES